MVFWLDVALLAFAIFVYAPAMYAYLGVLRLLSFLPTVRSHRKLLRDLGMDPKHAVWQAAGDRFANLIAVFTALGLIGLVLLGLGIGWLIWA